MKTKDLKYSKSVISNLAFSVAALVHLFIWDNYILACGLVLLAFTSGVFHYFKALYHERLDEEGPWPEVIHGKMRFWQDLDMISIYLIFAFYPVELTSSPWWALWAIPLILVSLNKLDLVFPNIKTDSKIVVPAAAIPVFILACFYAPLGLVISGIGFFLGAVVFSFLGDKSEKDADHSDHDNKHAVWHVLAALGFALIG